MANYGSCGIPQPFCSSARGFNARIARIVRKEGSHSKDVVVDDVHYKKEATKPLLLH